MWQPWHCQIRVQRFFLTHLKCFGVIYVSKVLQDAGGDDTQSLTVHSALDVSVMVMCQSGDAGSFTVTMNVTVAVIIICVCAMSPETTTS